MKLALVEGQGLGIVRDDLVIDASVSVASYKAKTNQELVEAVIKDFGALQAPLEELEKSGTGRPLSEAPGCPSRRPCPQGPCGPGYPALHGSHPG